MDSIWAVILGWIPHLTASSYVGLALYGFRMSIKRALVVGVFISFVGYGFKFLISLLSPPYGVHIPISVLVLMVALHIFVKIPWRTAVVAAISTYIIIAIVEVLTIMVMYDVLELKLSIDQILSKWWIQVSIVHLESIPIYILAVVLHIKKFAIFDLSGKNPEVRL
ncbi:MAG: hypothetical protein WA118_07325 [Carboxydocellales bacterium]|jgi:hypothetical protein